MGKPSVLFYEPKIPSVNEYSAFAKDFPLVGPLGMATMLRDKGYPVTVVNGNISPLLESDMRQHDVLVLSALTTSAPGAYRAAMAYRAANKKGRVLMGGPHATFVPEEAIRFADNVGTGEGENIIEGMVLGDYPSGTVVRGTPVENLDDVVLPDLGLIKGFKRRYAPASTTRGCPHDCDFCSVNGMYGRKQRQVSVDNAVEQFRRGQSAKSTFDYDDNFAANRRWAINFLDELAAQGINNPFIIQVRSTVGGDDELLEKLAAVHCSTACIGYESLSKAKLDEYGKGKTMPIEESAAGFHKHLIAVQAMLIYDGKREDGGDYDNPKEEARDFSSLPVDYMQLNILTPAPGSPLFDRVRKEGLFLNGLNPLADGDSWRHWQFFDGGHVVYRDPLNRGVEESYERLAEIQRRPYEILAKFYSPLRVLTHKKLKGGIDWKLAVFSWIAHKGRKNNRRFVKRLRSLGKR